TTTIDLSALKVISMRDVQGAVSEGVREVIVSHQSVITPSARDFLQQHNVALHNGNGTPQAAGAGHARKSVSSPATQAKCGRSVAQLFDSEEARAIKDEICAVGRKLWQRQYVDGNGGNISYRIGPNEVICTPTLISKADLKPEDLCMVDLEGN